MGRKTGDKNKNHIGYYCEICLKKFSQKNDLIRHKNRIIPCIKNNDKNIILDNENIILDDEKPDYNDIFKNNNNNNYDLILEFMKKINNDILNLNNKITKLEEDNEKLKEDNEKLKNQLILYNNTGKNTHYTFNLQINNFNDVKDFKGNFNNLLIENGKKIFLKTIENVFLNPDKPENHNIYVSDRNRKYVKTYNNGRWDTRDMNIIDDIIDNVVNYYNFSIEEIKKDYEKYEKLKNQINSKIKYVEYCDLDFLEDLKEKQIEENINNEKTINRCKEFRKMVYDEIITLFHDKKDIVLKTHKNQLSNDKICIK